MMLPQESGRFYSRLLCCIHRPLILSHYFGKGDSVAATDKPVNHANVTVQRVAASDNREGLNHLQMIWKG
jgi:hypothetical protein